MDLAAIQSALRERNIDAWLFYDHHHRDPIAYRVLEFTLGNKHPEMLEAHRREDADYQTLHRALSAPSLYDEVLRLLSQRGYGVPAAALSRDFTQPYVPSKQVTAAWLADDAERNAEKPIVVLKIDGGKTHFIASVNPTAPAK